MAESNLVRARVNGFEMNLGRAQAETTEDIEILDEPTHERDGSPRPTTRLDNRPVKPRTSVAEAAAAKARKAYDRKTVEELQNDVDARNDARGDGEPLIEIADPGNKPQLVDALVGDDQKKEKSQ